MIEKTGVNGNPISGWFCERNIILIFLLNLKAKCDTGHATVTRDPYSELLKGTCDTVYSDPETPAPGLPGYYLGNVADY